MNLQYFPMDRQLCHIEIESCEYPLINIFYFIFTYYKISHKIELKNYNQDKNVSMNKNIIGEQIHQLCCLPIIKGH